MAWRRSRRIYPTRYEVGGVGDSPESDDPDVVIALEAGYGWATITRIDGRDVIRLPGLCNREYELDVQMLEQALRDARASLAEYEGPTSTT
jgi:hypothetical protein